MAREGLFFRGTFLMKFLADELIRARREISCSLPEMRERYGDGLPDAVYLEYSIEPLSIREAEIQKREVIGYRDRNPFMIRPVSSKSPYAVACRVTEYRIPFEGDERLFDFTTQPFPFYPFGRLEEGMFVISSKEGEFFFTSDYEYNLGLLRRCVSITSAAVECYNSDLRAMIDEMIGEIVS